MIKDQRYTSYELRCCGGKRLVQALRVSSVSSHAFRVWRSDARLVHTSRTSHCETLTSLDVRRWTAWMAMLSVDFE
jgi:hypothetical protein